MLKKAIYAGLLCSVIGVPMAHAQTLSARGVQAVDSASGQSLAASLETLTRVVEGLNTQMSSVITRLDTIDTRLDGLDTRLNGIDTRLDGLDTRLDGVDTRLDAIEARLTTVETGVNTNATNINNLNTRLTTLEGDTGSVFAAMETRVETASTCQRNKGGYATIYASCKAGYKLLSCSGGTGDVYEDDEGYYVKPDLTNNRCELKVKAPACRFPTNDTVRSNVYAVCVKA